LTLRLAILCPGQGAQHSLMFNLALTDPAVAQTIDYWGLPAMHDLFANQIAQPLIVGAACAIWQALSKKIPTPQIVAGYSVGELSALAVAGALDSAQTIALANARSRFMNACVDPRQPQGLLAVSGVTLDVLTPLLTQSSGLQALSIAIEIDSDQFVIGGFQSDIAVLQKKLFGITNYVQLLPVAIASHTSFMQAAAKPLTSYMQNLPFLQPQLKLLSGVTGQGVGNVPALINCLATQMIQTIRWSSCMNTIAEAGINVALELGPGKALSRLLSVRHPQIICRSVDEFRSIDAIVNWLDRIDSD
jgi:[acyl-carrier-protein] S-malonyltransferase